MEACLAPWNTSVPAPSTIRHTYPFILASITMVCRTVDRGSAGGSSPRMTDGAVTPIERIAPALVIDLIVPGSTFGISCVVKPLVSRSEIRLD